MKNIIAALIITMCSMSAHAWSVDPRFPTFTVDGIQFMLTTQDDEMGTSIVMLYKNGNDWISWGGTPDVTGTIMEGVTDAKIMEKGSLRDFIVWCTQEAQRRAQLKAVLPLPDPNNRIARLKYNMLMSVDNDTLTVAPPPLP